MTFWWDTRDSEYHPINRLLTTYKGKKSNFLVENHGGHYLNLVIKTITINMRADGHHAPPDTTHQEGQNITSVVFLWKTHNLKPTMRTLWTIQTEVHYYTTCLYCSKNVKVKKHKPRLRRYSWLKMTKEIEQLNTNINYIGSWAGKKIEIENIIGKVDKIWIWAVG